MSDVQETIELATLDREMAEEKVSVSAVLSLSVCPSIVCPCSCACPPDSLSIGLCVSQSV